MLNNPKYDSFMKGGNCKNLKVKCVLPKFMCFDAFS